MVSRCQHCTAEAAGPGSYDAWLCLPASPQRPAPPPSTHPYPTLPPPPLVQAAPWAPGLWAWPPPTPGRRACLALAHWARTFPTHPSVSASLAMVERHVMSCHVMLAACWLAACWLAACWLAACWLAGLLASWLAG